MPFNERWRDPDAAWARFQPGDSRPWNLRWAGHLFRRAGFGASWTQLQEALAAGPQATIDKFLKTDDARAAFQRQYDEYDVSAASGQIDELRAWWLRRIIHTPDPLLEKMTLFWHSHFGTTAARVEYPGMMLDHVRVLRGNALGSFRTLLEQVARDPATLVSLGAEANRKAMPSEPMARRMLDQYTLGPGNYGDEDVHEVSRAFTGQFVLRREFRFFDREHDPGVKRVLGSEGAFGVAEIVDLLARQPATASLVVRKLYRWLISETDEPDAELLEPLVKRFAADHDIGRLVETMLRSNLFFSEIAWRRRVKSPVEFAVGIVRGLEGTVPTLPLGHALAELGQNLYSPPTVDGWIGGPCWINRATLAGRANLAVQLLAADGLYAGKLDPASLASKHGRAEARRFFLDLFLQTGVPAGLPDDARALAQAVVTMPEFQLA
jgi:uncharacterized protein (DUF1800 family)